MLNMTCLSEHGLATKAVYWKRFAPRMSSQATCNSPLNTKNDGFASLYKSRHASLTPLNVIRLWMERLCTVWPNDWPCLFPSLKPNTDFGLWSHQLTFKTYRMKNKNHYAELWFGRETTVIPALTFALFFCLFSFLCKTELIFSDLL